MQRGPVLGAGVLSIQDLSGAIDFHVAEDVDGPTRIKAKRQVNSVELVNLRISGIFIVISRAITQADPSRLKWSWQRWNKQ